MELITEPNQLYNNINYFEEYLINGTDAERNKIKSLIKRGRCFVAYTVNNNISFAPSRFLGYADNNLDKHQNSITKHGTLTNSVIDKVLKLKHFTSEDFEIKYAQYCRSIDIEPTDYKFRKFWHVDIDREFDENNELDCKKPEGRIVERIHKTRERNSKVVAVAKSNFKLKHGRLFCEACHFDFEKIYGKIGIDFIEAHHSVLVSEMNENHITSSNDFVLLCSNCHSMIHKIDEGLSKENLNKLFK